MRQKELIRYLFLSLISVISLTKISAQTTKVAVVLLADTNIVYQHVGLTMFANYTDSLKLDFSVNDYIAKQLKDSLSSKYEVSFIDYLPETVISRSESPFNVLGIKKTVKKWLKDVKDKYDYVVFTSNMPIPSEWNIIVPNNTSGLYSRGKTLAYYSTIVFLLYETESAHSISYLYIDGDILSPLKGFVMPEDNRTFTTEMLAELKTGFKQYLKSRVDYFFSQTGLYP